MKCLTCTDGLMFHLNIPTTSWHSIALNISILLGPGKHHCISPCFRIPPSLHTFLMSFHLSQLLCACSVCKAHFPSFQPHLRARFDPICSLLGLCSPKGFLCQSTWSSIKGRSWAKPNTPQELPQPSCTFHCKSTHSVHYHSINLIERKSKVFEHWKWPRSIQTIEFTQKRIQGFFRISSPFKAVQQHTFPSAFSSGNFSVLKPQFGGEDLLKDLPPVHIRDTRTH